MVVATPASEPLQDLHCLVASASLLDCNSDIGGLHELRLSVFVVKDVPAWNPHEAELSWNRLDGRRASVINTNYPDDVDVEDRDTWPTLWEWLVPTMGRLANAIDPVLDRY